MGNISSPIVQRTLVRADRETVWNALTTGKGLDKWFTDGSTSDSVAGGKIRFVWREWGVDKVNTDAGGPILEARSPERFVFQWWDDRPTTVEIDLSETDEGTVVKVTESGYEDSPEGWRRCIECATGWGEALTLLKFYLEHGVRY